MHISKIGIKNFRILRESTLDLRESLSLIVGKNNSGKTSLLVLIEKFLKPQSFHYNDFPLSLRKEIQDMNDKTDINSLSIRMIVEIEYNEDDNLEYLSEFILNLDPEIKIVKMLFECRINKESLIKELADVQGDERKNIIIKNLNRYLISKVYVFDDSGHDSSSDFIKDNRHKLIEKELKDIKGLINLHVIHARRNVASSEESTGGKKPLSTITTAYFNSQSEHEIPNADLDGINKTLAKMDEELNAEYKSFFSSFLENSKKFLGLGKLSVVSSIKSETLLDNSSEVVYGDGDSRLPEHLNGLGYMNILYLLLQVEITKEDFKKQNKCLNLLFIEEPEAHTHPQMQYVFANEIQRLIKDIKGLQTLITSHSSHIISQSDFENLRYLKLVNDDNVEIKNFHTELRQKYSEKEQFKFLEQYLNIQSAELFFASKVIFIEGITERMLLPYFIKRFDDEKLLADGDYIPLASQNVSILEVGANAKVFAPFLEFLGIKTLVITDIDTTLKTVGEKTTTYPAEPVATASHTSNATLKYFLKAPDIKSPKFDAWFVKLCDHSLDSLHECVNTAYQKEENGYHARSFEDAFISLNKELIKSNLSEIEGLKCLKEFDTNKNIYELTKNILDKKSYFAASLLYLALTKSDVKWKTPFYIQEGLEWLQKE